LQCAGKQRSGSARAEQARANGVSSDSHYVPQIKVLPSPLPVVVAPGKPDVAIAGGECLVDLQLRGVNFRYVDSASARVATFC
jgi:hypothetical protein